MSGIPKTCQHQRLSQDTLAAFVEALRLTGNITHASKSVGITTTTAFDWKNRSEADPKDGRYILVDPLGERPDRTLHQAWTAAVNEAIESRVHDKAMELATGYDDPVVYQGKLAFKPDYGAEYKVDPITGLVYYPPLIDPITGEPEVLTIRRVSERMIGDILKARHPAYRPKLDVDMTTQGKPFAVPQQAVTMKEFLAAFGRKPETE